MKVLKTVGKGLLVLLLLPIVYLVVSLLLTMIPVNTAPANAHDTQTVYLSTSGVHADIVIPVDLVAPELKAGLQYSNSVQYLSFGWGDEIFFLNTPTWGDLTAKNACRALLWKSPSLMHVTRHRKDRSSWLPVVLSPEELRRVNQYIVASFEQNEDGEKILLPNSGYSTNDDFYRAVGSYSCLNTCNTWANRIFKDSGLYACWWTPFDFGLLKRYR